MKTRREKELHTLKKSIIHVVDLQWKSIPGYRKYFADTEGRIHRIQFGGFHPLVEGTSRDGYTSVEVQPDGKQHRCVVKSHSLIALAFLPKKPTSKHQIRHLDGDRRNSRPSNLKWGTAKENAADRALHGRTVWGERCHKAKLTMIDVRLIKKALRRNVKQAQLAREYGVRRCTINNIAMGRTWKQHK